MFKRQKINSDEYLKFINLISEVIKNNENKDELEDVIKELKNVTIHAESILDVMRSTPKAFSMVKYNDLLKINSEMKWNLPRDLYEINDYEPQLIKIPINILETIKDGIQGSTDTIGILSQLDNEAKKKRYIDAFIDPCLRFFKGELINDIEGIVDSNIFRGRIEYILKAFSDVIIVIIEAKKDIEFQSSYGQIIAELYNAWCYNNEKELPVYGILTTASSWRWWKYDGKTFSASLQTTELRRLDKKSIPIIASKIYSIVIEAWVECCKIYFRKNKINDSKIPNFEKLKEEIWNAKTNEESDIAFNNFKTNINKLKKILDHEEYNWDIDFEYI